MARFLSAPWGNYLNPEAERRKLRLSGSGILQVAVLKSGFESCEPVEWPASMIGGRRCLWS
jgi:hypothetical protein